MNNYRFTLEPYNGLKSRFRCPMCRHQAKTFKRYIDTETRQYLADHVGKCDREDKWGYHYSPREYFRANPQAAPVWTPPTHDIPALKTYDTIPLKYMQQSMGCGHNNNFLVFLRLLFNDNNHGLAEKYHIGTNHHWPGATVFWQMDVTGKLRTGKVMLYNPRTCSRVKKPYNHIAWVHNLLYAKTDGFKLKQCLFGEHLLALEPDKPVGITESEKTAVMASYMMPGFVWLAAGSRQGLTERKCRVLINRTVVLFPDVGAYDYWTECAQMLNRKIRNATITVHREMEQTATKEERNNGADMGDRWIEELFEIIKHEKQ